MRLARTITSTLSILLVGPLSSAFADPDYEALYQERFKTIMESGGMMPSYDPMAEVVGTSDFTPLPKAAAADIEIQTEALEAARDYAKANNSDAFIVWHKGKIVTADYFGETTSTTPLVSKSLSKPLSAIAVGRAIALGYIDSLDQPVADFITEWQGTDKAEVLMRHLLDMRSGFLAQGYSTDPDHPWNRAYLSYQLEDYLIHSYPLVEKPGAKYQYNNATADMVSVLIKRATGTSYQDFIGKQVLSLIGARGGSIWTDHEDGLAHSGCCMLLPADSYLRLAQLLLQDGSYNDKRLLPKGYVHAMTTATPQNPHFGLGIWIGGDYTERRGFQGPEGKGPKVLHSEPYLDKTLYLFDGNANQVVYVMPEYQMLVLRLGNKPPTSPEWDNSRLPNLLIRGLQPPVN